MTRDEPISQTNSKPRANGRIALDQARVRATLRLCFAAEQADALAVRVTWDADNAREALAPLVRPARLSYGSARLLSPIRRLRRTKHAERLLAPCFGLASGSALALALHLGLRLNIETLAALFGCSEREMSLALYEARRAIEPERVTPCADLVAAIGRYRDPVDESAAERLAFMQPVATCSRCRPALEAARAVDERLLMFIDAHERALPPMPKSDRGRRALWLEPALLWGGVALLLVVLLAGGTIGARRWLRNEAPVPLLSAEAASPKFSGWLLQTSDTGDISAVNLASGEHRLLIPGVANRTAQFKLAPDQRQIARITYRTNSDAPSTLTVYGLDGTVKQEWDRLSPTDINLALGWLNRTTVFVSSIPARIPNETAAAFNARAQETGRLMAFDVRTGAQRVLLNGWVDGALVSPDGERIVIVRNVSDSERVVEIRPITASGLGAPVTTSQQNAVAYIAVGPLAWTADNRVIVQKQTSAGTTINSLALDGTVTQLDQPDPGALPNILSLSPDSSALIYATTQNPGAGPWNYWRLNLGDGTTQKLATGGQGFSYTQLSQVVWSPDSARLALTLNEPFYLPGAAKSGSATSIAAQRVAAFDANGQALGSLLEQFDKQSLLAWLPEEALPTRTAAESGTSAHSGAFTSAGLLQMGGFQPDLSSASLLSPDGDKALVNESAYDFAMAISLGDDGFQTAGLPNDPGWLPDSSGTIGVQTHTSGDASTSRIGIYGDIGAPGESVTDYDPAQLGDSTTAAYRYPMLAPDGLHYSFFVRDRQTVTLWIGGYQEAPRTVASWQIPSGAKIDPPLIARWIDKTTLIDAEPGDWHNGLPRFVTLHRVTLANGTATDSALVSWQPHGSERGIVLRELRISADQTEIAIRLRHVTGSDPEKDAFDSIAAIDTSDLTQSVELARGTPGDGLSWSPDGAQLVAVIQKKLTVFTIQGGGIQQIGTGARPASYPLWVLPNEIWYQSGTGTASQMIRATR
ncbi:MAG TPA: hypothetical protein VF201_06265 [Nitrolancea sp.]